MNLNSDGMPCQADGDSADTLNRVGLLALNDKLWLDRLPRLETTKPGQMKRFVDGNPNNVSGDQLVPAFASLLLWRYVKHLTFNSLVWAMIKRVGFAQNTRDTNGSRKILPDFLFHRVLPFISRAYLPQVFIEFLDVVLFVNTLATVIDIRLRNDPDHVDPYVNACATLYACNVKKPTYLSRLSVRMLERTALEPNIDMRTSFTPGDITFCFGAPETPFGPYSTFFPAYVSNVAAGLRWYHRAQSGGNPEIGEVQVDQWTRSLKIARS